MLNPTKWMRTFIETIAIAAFWCALLGVGMLVSSLAVWLISDFGPVDPLR